MRWVLYNVLFALVFPLLLPRYLVRMARRGGYARGFAERFGLYRPGVRARLAEGGRVWIHAVSVGEFFVALGLAGEIRRRRPAARFVFTVNTSTGRALAERRLDPRDVLLYFPLDLPPFARRALRRIRPAALVLVEGELWPNLVRLAQESGVPVALVNARVSDGSYRGYRALRAFTRPLLARFALVSAQGPVDRDRLLDLGAPPARTRVAGSAKYDLAEPDAAGAGRARALLAAAGLPPSGARVLVGGSTWPGEEAALLGVLAALRPAHPELVLVLVPRHAERADDVAAAVSARGLSLVRRSAVDPAHPAARRPDVVLVDSTGELRDFYAAADLVFVGKSLAEHGGQNPIEPAALGRPVICGPNMENFRDVARDFDEARAWVRVADSNALRDAVSKLLDDDAERARLGAAAGRLVAGRTGALRRTVDGLEEALTTGGPGMAADAKT